MPQPKTRMFGVHSLALALVWLVTDAAAALDVRLENRSRPADCAEVDNVDFRFSAPTPVAFRIEATFPNYFHPNLTDRTAPVWDDCEGYATDDPVHRSPPGRQIIYEDAKWLLAGVREPSFWRPASVPVRVDGEAFAGLHYVQLHHKREAGEAVEVLVLYPPDGYWRAKPLAPAAHEEKHGRDTAFGSSFLVGPIEEDGRPFVDLEQVRFVPEQAAFELRLARGGTATVRVAEVSVQRLALQVSIDREADTSEIAALRSMFVRPTMADATILRWRDGDDAGARNVLEPITESVESAAFVRDEVSRHNTSAPNIRFTDFRRLTRDGPAAAAPSARRP